MSAKWKRLGADAGNEALVGQVDAREWNIRVEWSTVRDARTSALRFCIIASNSDTTSDNDRVALI